MNTQDNFGERTSVIQVHVSPEIAQKWGLADPAQRERAELAFSYSMMDKSEVAEELARYLDKTGDEASARGWTDKDESALLKGEYD